MAAERFGDSSAAVIVGPHLGDIAAGDAVACHDGAGPADPEERRVDAAADLDELAVADLAGRSYIPKL